MGVPFSIAYAIALAVARSWVVTLPDAGLPRPSSPGPVEPLRELHATLAAGVVELMRWGLVSDIEEREYRFR
jgi:hypothetical protein